VYEKIASKDNCWGRVYLNTMVQEDLAWFVANVECSSGILVYQAVDWHPLSECDIQIRCDACLTGLGFWVPSMSLGFFAQVPRQLTDPKIFFWEATSVLSALLWFSDSLRPLLSKFTPARLTIFTDNMNTVHLFDSLAARPGYNDIVRRAADVLNHCSVDLRVLHVLGEDNEVADSLSRQRFDLAILAHPGLQISEFQPPPVRLGAFGS
jgi:hypothetical protein